ncbi:general transcription factor II-I repeat domain-containing protein 2B [Trichonephila clavipes]|nr:general transcription factor II-I repeat domain-containing protein 2B [Trichonephila clavipes]
MATKKKQRKTEDENRQFKVEWTENFAFIQTLNGLPTCLISKEKFAHNKSNLERHFTRKHASFSTKYPKGDARKKAAEELQKSQESSTSVFNNCPKEELLGLLPLKGQTQGEDIANAVIECMDKHPIPLDKIVLISTDGAKSMTGSFSFNARKSDSTESAHLAHFDENYSEDDWFAELAVFLD